MLIPNSDKAVVDVRKLRDYCLNPNHEIGKHKARVFESALDLTVEDAEELKKVLLSAVKRIEAKVDKFDRFGQRYTVEFAMKSGEKSATIRSAWIIETDTDFPKLTTCFVL